MGPKISRKALALVFFEITIDFFRDMDCNRLRKKTQNAQTETNTTST